MDSTYIINELEKNKTIFLDLLQYAKSDFIKWRQNPDKWCLLEIVCHLYDEEREDFRTRVKITLENPGEELPKINPAGWVQSRNYMSQDYSQKLNDFIKEREISIMFLKELKSPQWDNYFQHPKFGKMTSKLFFTNWLAHDYLHIRQILKLKFDYLSATTSEKLNYAGEW